ncbi:MAG: isocitrate/isopropylmalate family dehydrogenase, partial [Saezia sp.]
LANPSSLLLSAAMMLEYIGWDKPAKLLEKAMERSFTSECATADLARFMKNGTALSTSAFAEGLKCYMNELTN